MPEQETKPPQSTQPASPTDPQFQGTSSFPTPAHPSPSHMPKWFAMLGIVFFILVFGIGTYSVVTQKETKPESLLANPTSTPILSPTHYTQQDTAIPQGYMVYLLEHGGMCPDGECRSAHFIEATGAVSVNGKIVKQLSKEEIQSLSDIIKNTDFEKIKANKFTGTCPLAYDGVESVYYIATDHGVEKLASCEVTINNQTPIFNAITTIFDFDSLNR